MVSLSKESTPNMGATPTPRSLGPYRVGRRIGSGGMASVFEATHDQLGKAVALKVLHPHIADEPRAVARFLREGQAAARIRHPHAVNVIDAGVGSEGTPYLVMELERGETLASLLRTFGALEPAQAVDLVLPVVSAVQIAHSLGIVHRDIKPGNILIATDHVGDSVAKITDFGISRSIEAASENPITTERGVLGTLPYMAPEQLLAAHEATAASDQYSFGVVLYECFTGRLPFDAEGSIELASAFLHAPLVSPRAFRPEIPAPLDAIVCRALDRTPERRFSTMRALGEALLPYASERVALACAREFKATTARDAPRPSPRARLDSETLAEQRLSRAPAPTRRTVARSAVVIAVAVLAFVALFAWGISRGQSRQGPTSVALIARSVLPAPAEVAIPPSVATPPAVTAPPPVAETAMSAPTSSENGVAAPASRKSEASSIKRAPARFPQPLRPKSSTPILD